MPAVITTVERATARSIRLKRFNALTALFSGITPALILAFIFPGRREGYALGFLVGILWSNAFEYFYHRSLLHGPVSAWSRYHLEHHAATGTPDEVEHVNFGESPAWVALLFASNGIVVVIVDLIFGLRIAPGVLVAFSVYFVVLEEIHWRIHLDGWLPPGLRSARVYHLLHHDRPDSRFNVFVPLFDWLCGTTVSHAARPTCRSAE